MEAVEEYRRISGLESVSSTCFKAARISTVIFDDGIHLDKILDTEWHRSFTPHVARLVRVERLAENILNEVRFLFTFTFNSCICIYETLTQIPNMILIVKQVALMLNVICSWYIHQPLRFVVEKVIVQITQLF